MFDDLKPAFHLMQITKIHLYFFLLTVLLPLTGLFSQEETKQKKLRFSADAKFRFEPDWNSRKSDGTYRDDRFRMRFRVRAGLNYSPNDWASFGVRFRTGYAEKQQDPNLTIGDGYHEFESVPIGMDKLFFRVKLKSFDGWLGRNTLPFERQNELFWSDHVAIDGVYLSSKQTTNANWIHAIGYSGGLFTMLNSYGTFDDDSFIGIVQVTTSHLDNRLRVFPTFYFFNNMPDVPDGNESTRFDYKIVHLGAKALVSEHPKINLGIDIYQNLQNYEDNQLIPDDLKDQKTGIVFNALYGSLDKKGNMAFGLDLTYLERYAAVDFIAQNDWVRWDYSSQGSRDGRLTNYKGISLMTGYRISKMLQVKVRYFTVEQLIPYGRSLENGNRIRLDIDFKW